jgi:hypothetical protein
VAAYQVRLIRGPCAGQVKTLTPAAFAAGETSCKGATYIYDGVTRPKGQLPHFTYRKGAPPPPPTGGGVNAPHALGGWNAIRRVMNSQFPHAVHRMGKLNHATSTLIARRGRVRH